MLPRAAAGTPRLRSPLHHVARDTSSNKRSSSDERVDRPRAGAVDDQRDRRAKREEVVLHALAVLRARPVHKEAVLLVNEDRHEHDDRDAERCDAREQADRQAERAEKFGNHGKECKSRREAGLREVRHGAPEAVTAEPSERLLRAVWEHHNGKGQPEDQWNNATIRRDEPVDHDDLHDTSASVPNYLFFRRDRQNEPYRTDVTTAARRRPPIILGSLYGQRSKGSCPPPRSSRGRPRRAKPLRRARRRRRAPPSGRDPQPRRPR